LLLRNRSSNAAMGVVAHVRRSSCLTRHAAADSPECLAKLPARSALLVSSGEALSVLWQALDDVGRAALQRRLAVASSERLRARLVALGFARVIRAASAHPAALLDALVAHVGHGGFR